MRLEVMIYRPVVDPLEEFRLDVAFPVGKPHGNLRAGDADAIEVALAREVGDAIEHQPMPSLEDLLDASLGFAVSGNTLDQIRVMRLAVHRAVIDTERGGRDLPRMIELLAMPHQIVVAKQLAGNSLERRTHRENYHLPETIDVEPTQH